MPNLINLTTPIVETKTTTQVHGRNAEINANGKVSVALLDENEEFFKTVVLGGELVDDGEGNMIPDTSLADSIWDIIETALTGQTTYIGTKTPVIKIKP